MNKKFVFFIVYCAVGLLCCNAQTFSSVEEQYSDLQCRDTVVARINPLDNNSTIISLNDDLYGLPSFVYHTHSGTGASRRFPWPILANYYGGIFYKVNDMVVIGGRCYFCGGKSAPIGYEYTLDGHAVLFYQTTGYFGWFDVGQMSTPSPTVLDVYLFDLPVSDELKRMDGIMEAGDVELGLISERQLAIVNGYGTSWACHVQDVSTLERLEDVKITLNHLVTLSRFVGDYYSFGLRCESKTDAFISPVTHQLNNYYSGIMFNTHPMTTASLPNGHPTMHQEKEGMRMVDHPGTDYVTVAYNGDYFDSGDCQHFSFYTAMYRMDLSNCTPGYVAITMDDAQLLTTGLLKLAHYMLWEMRYVPTASTIALLQGMITESQGMWSVLQVASWNPSWMPRSVQADYRALKSMDVDAAGWAYLAGKRMPDKTLLHFRQDAGMMERSCYSTRPATIVEKLTLNPVENPVPIEPSDIPPTITPVHFQINATNSEYYPQCNTSY